MYINKDFIKKYKIYIYATRVYSLYSMSKELRMNFSRMTVADSSN